MSSNALTGGAPAIIDVHAGWGATGTATGWNDIATVRTVMGQRGIQTACVSSVLARRYDLPSGNDALAGALSGLEDAYGATDLRGWLVIHPARLADSNAQMRKHLFSARFVGVALYPDPVTGALVALRDVQELVTGFRRYAKPLLIETRTAEAMAQVVSLAESMGGVKVIASGMGGDEWREAISLAAHPLNLFCDISGTPEPEKVEFAIQTFSGTRKLLFASGAPFLDPAVNLGMLDDLNLSADDRERILFSNAARLFGMNTGAEPTISLTPLA